MTTKAVILVGGKGTRLSSVVSDVPKPLAPIAGKPFLDHLLEDLVQQGIQDVILAVGYMPEKFDPYGHRAADFKLNSLLISREDQPLGTGGALGLIRPLLKDKESLLVVNGDTFFQGDLKGFLATKNEGVLAASIGVCYVDDLSRFGSIEFDAAGVIKSFREKRSGADGYVNAGLYILSAEILDLIPSGKFVSLETDIFPQLVAQGALKAAQIKGSFFDIGIPESYFSFFLDLTIQQATAQYGLGFSHLLLSWLRGARILVHQGAPEISPAAMALLKERAFVKVVSSEQAIAHAPLLSKDDALYCDSQLGLDIFLKTQVKIVTSEKVSGSDGVVERPLDEGALRFFELLKGISDKVSRSPIRAVPHLFLDRDGIIIDYIPYIKEAKDVRLNDGIVDLIRRARSQGYRVVMVSNQSGIGREYFSQDQYMKVQNRMLELLALEGQWIDVCHFAPFQESSRRAAFLFYPSYRKPRGGMIWAELDEWNVDFEKSIMVGDHISDMVCGFNAHIKNRYLLASNNHGPLKTPVGVEYKTVSRLSEVMFL